MRAAYRHPWSGRPIVGRVEEILWRLAVLTVALLGALLLLLTLVAATLLPLGLALVALALAAVQCGVLRALAARLGWAALAVGAASALGLLVTMFVYRHHPALDVVWILGVALTVGLTPHLPLLRPLASTTTTAMVAT